MDEEAVHEGGVARRQAQRQADHGNIPGPAQARDRGRGLVGEVVAAGGKRNACRIEDQVLGPLPHLGRDRRGGEIMGKARQHLGDQRRLSFRVGRLVHSAKHHIHGWPPGTRSLMMHQSRCRWSRSSRRIDQLEPMLDTSKSRIEAVHPMVHARDVLAQMRKIDAQPGDLAFQWNSGARQSRRTARSSCRASRRCRRKRS